MPESKTTEILCVTEQKWVQGPRLPVDLGFATCAALPPTSNFACVIVGCSLSEKSFLYVYGLDKNLSEWTLLGRIKNEDTVTLQYQFHSMELSSLYHCYMFSLNFSRNIHLTVNVLF